MKQAILVCLLTLALSTLLPAAWQWQNPLPQGNALRDVAFVSAGEGFAVGEHGTLLHTADGGLHWQCLPSPTTALLCRVTAIDAEHAWAVGYNGTVLTGGATTPWVVRTSGVLRDLRAVDFVDVFHGWAVGDSGTVYRTTDGGENWVGQDSVVVHDGAIDHALIEDLLGVDFVDASTGYAVGGFSMLRPAVIIKTVDGGATWFVQEAGYNGWLADVTFTSATHGCAVGRMAGNVLLLETTDGETWTARVQMVADQALRSVAFGDAQHGFAAGEYGLLLKTVNGGESWESDYLDGVLRFDGLAAAGGAYWCVGDGGAIFHTSATEVPWTRQDHGAGYLLGSIALASAEIGYAADYDGRALRTTDGGANWLPDAADSGHVLYDVSFLDAATGWKVGAEGRISQTTDGGATWTLRREGDTILNAVRFANPRHGWAVGNNGLILHTTDGGDTWQEQQNGQGTFISAVWTADSNTAWTAGGSGLIFHTTDAGANWLPQTTTTTQALRSISFVGPLEGWVAGDFGTILHTVDGGANWIQQPNVTTAALWSVAFLNSDTGFAAGWGGTLLHTVDGGVIWHVDPSPTTNVLLDLAAAPSGRVWACGVNGTILSLGDFEHGAAITAPPILQPSSFRLAAYPNPFNPTTTLAFTLPVAGRVTLAVYDLTGRRVTTLTDGVLTAGEQTLILDASAWPSGLYFARITTPAASLTRKLVLLK